MASIELDRCATVHEMSNQQSLKQSFPNTNLDHLDLYSGPFSILLAGGCPQVVILLQLPFAVEMWFQMGQIANTAWKNICGTLAVQLQRLTFHESSRADEPSIYQYNH